MKSGGIVRRLDYVGRLTLPSELRRILGIRAGDGLGIFVEGNSVILQKYVSSCIFCGRVEKNAVTFYSKGICEQCLSTLPEIERVSREKMISISSGLNRGGRLVVNTDEVTRVVKTYLPWAETSLVDKITSDVIQDAENIIHSLIRQAVAQEREKVVSNRDD